MAAVVLVGYRLWEVSSAGSEHLLYTQRVIGSNPILPTKNSDFDVVLHLLLIIGLIIVF